MLQIFKTDITTGKLIELDEIENHCWVNLINPTTDEINHIVERTNVPVEFIRDPLDNDESSRIEREDDNVLIIADFPIENTDDDVSSISFETMPLGIIITDKVFITVCSENSPILQSFIHQKVRNFYTNMKTRFALQILYLISTSYLRLLKRLNRHSDRIEKELHRSMKNKQLYDLMGIEKSLVYFVTSLKTNKVVLDKMFRQNMIRMYEEDQDLLEDVIIENRQGLEMAEIHSNILSGMMDAYASIIGNNMNIVMKFLTTVTIILSFPTMVFSFYGMNVKLPFMDNEFGWIIAIGFAIFIAIVTAIFFSRKKFF